MNEPFVSFDDVIQCVTTNEQNMVLPPSSQYSWTTRTEEWVHTWLMIRRSEADSPVTNHTKKPFSFFNSCWRVVSIEWWIVEILSFVRDSSMSVTPRMNHSLLSHPKYIDTVSLVIKVDYTNTNPQMTDIQEKNQMKQEYDSLQQSLKDYPKQPNLVSFGASYREDTMPSQRKMFSNSFYA